MKVLIAIILVVCSVENTSANEICPSSNKDELACYSLEKLPFWASDGQYYTEIKLLQHICKDQEIKCTLKIEVYPPDPCLNDPCCGIHNSLCAKTHIDKYECLCKTGYLPSGSGCEIDPCFNDPCSGSNNTACIVCNGQYDCVCVEGFIPIDNDALNNGCQEVLDLCITCTSVDNTKCIVESATGAADCVCIEGFLPIDNDTMSNGCQEDPCFLCNIVDNTTCIVESTTGTPYCACIEGFVPIDIDAMSNGCQEVLDPCFPCNNVKNTTCVENSGTKDCVCIPCHKPIGIDALQNGCEPVYPAVPVIECSDCELDDYFFFSYYPSQCPDHAPGNIQTPYYPNNYSASTCLSWILRASVGKRIEITFEDFVLPEDPQIDCFPDYLDIRDGNSETSRLLGHLCRSPTVPFSYTSTGSTMFLAFTSNSISKGFTMCSRQID